MTWIDGKKIYRKTVNFGQLPNNVAKNVAHGITELTQIIDIKTIAKNSSNSFYPIPYAVGGTTLDAFPFGIEMNVSLTNIQIRTNRDATAFTTTYVTLEYTKN